MEAVIASAATRRSDLLDGMKRRLFGRLDPAMLLRLKTAATGLKDLSGDPRVDQVLAEIGPRAKTRAPGKHARQRPHARRAVRRNSFAIGD